MLERVGVEHDAAAHRLERRIKPHDKTVARLERNLFLEPQLGVALPARADLFGVEQHDFAQNLARAVVKV